MPTTATRIAATPQQVIAALTAAMRGSTRLPSRPLHPAVHAPYGEDGCRAYLGRLRPPDLRAEVLSTGPSEPGPMPPTVARRRSPSPSPSVCASLRNGTDFAESDSHVVVDAEGRVLWLTDCGTPL